MLTFLTLLLGIVSGPRTIVLNAGPDSASVELLLDGELVGLSRAPPWAFVVDFGETPAPHHLDAIARNANGAEIARARQRVNFPRPAAEAAIVLLPGTGGTGRLARLSWETAVAPRPEKMTVTFDGKILPASDPERIELPPFVPERLHFLRATLDFRDDVAATAEITFGGRTRDKTEKELTAFPVRFPGGRVPVPEAMDGWFLADGAALHVAAVDEGEPSITFVLDADGPPEFRRMRNAWLPNVTGTLPGTIRTLLAYPEARAGPRTFYQVFPGSLPTSERQTVLSILAGVHAGKNGQRCPRLADAVAVAGLDATENSHPRIVVLILTGNPDASALSARAARAYLSALCVPLVVWITGPAKPIAALDWGGGEVVRTWSALRKAVKSLETMLDEQRIVWVEGAHLPQSISVSWKAASGVVLVR